MQRRRVAGLDPVAEGGAEVHQRVAEGRHLPVEHAAHGAEVGRVEHQVVGLEVVVDQGGAAFGRLVGGEPRGEALQVREVLGGRGVIALASSRAPGARHTLRGDRGRRGRPPPGRRGGGQRAPRHRRRRSAPPPFGIERHVGGQPGAQDHPGNPLHDEERRAEHGRVVAEGERRAARADTPARAATARGTRAPMSCAVATVLPTGGRRTTRSRPSSADEIGEVRVPLAELQHLERRRAARLAIRGASAQPPFESRGGRPPRRRAGGSARSSRGWRSSLTVPPPPPAPGGAASRGRPPCGAPRRPVVDARRALVAAEPGERRAVGDAERTVRPGSPGRARRAWCGRRRP